MNGLVIFLKKIMCESSTLHYLCFLFSVFRSILMPLVVKETFRHEWVSYILEKNHV